ncbi:hypothetical protein Brsp07_03447 [Brucella sp. NBRC 14130]
MEPKDRLKEARIKAGFETPSDAARVLKEINKNTLISNENGNRPISRKAAEKYGELFGVDPGWILFGEGGSPEDKISGATQIEAMLRRIKGLNDQDILVVMSVIMNAIRVNGDEQEQIQLDDQSGQTTDHHKVKP